MVQCKRSGCLNLQKLLTLHSQTDFIDSVEGLGVQESLFGGRGDVDGLRREGLLEEALAQAHTAFTTYFQQNYTPWRSKKYQ